MSGPVAGTGSYHRAHPLVGGTCRERNSNSLSGRSRPKGCSVAHLPVEILAPCEMARDRSPACVDSTKPNQPCTRLRSVPRGHHVLQSIAGFVLARNTNPAAAPWPAQTMFFGIDIQHQRDPIPSAALSHDIEHEPSRRRSIKLFKLWHLCCSPSCWSLPFGGVSRSETFRRLVEVGLKAKK
jgi:hypothetical protein